MSSNIGGGKMKFEYRVYTYNNQSYMNNDETLERDLNRYGKEGWELVSALPVIDGSGSEGDIRVDTDDIKFIFKRNLIG